MASEPRKNTKIDHQTGVLLVGHGTRDPAGQKEFLAFATALKVRLSTALEPVFLELAEPSISTGLARLAAQGISRLVCAPLLLFSAGHAKVDIPTEVSAALTTFPDINVEYSSPLGEHPAIIELISRRVAEATEPEAPTTFVMIGRGSSDLDATQALQRIAAICGARTNAAHTIVGFAAVQKPTIAEALTTAVQSASPRIVVHPHFLFMGELWRELSQTISQMSGQTTHVEITLLPPLGPAEEVILAAADRIAEIL